MGWPACWRAVLAVGLGVPRWPSPCCPFSRPRVRASSGLNGRFAPAKVRLTRAPAAKNVAAIRGRGETGHALGFAADVAVSWNEGSLGRRGGSIGERWPVDSDDHQRSRSSLGVRSLHQACMPMPANTILGKPTKRQQISPRGHHPAAAAPARTERTPLRPPSRRRATHGRSGGPGNDHVELGCVRSTRDACLAGRTETWWTRRSPASPGMHAPGSGSTPTQRDHSQPGVRVGRWT